MATPLDDVASQRPGTIRNDISVEGAVLLTDAFDKFTGSLLETGRFGVEVGQISPDSKSLPLPQPDVDHREHQRQVPETAGDRAPGGQQHHRQARLPLQHLPQDNYGSHVQAADEGGSVPDDEAKEIGAANPDPRLFAIGYRQPHHLGLKPAPELVDAHSLLADDQRRHGGVHGRRRHSNLDTSVLEKLQALVFPLRVWPPDPRLGG
ncbi:uncharacterized protein ColSpa_11898 [Colletotrichum spaethianum]|uniref:Uncharacterized protein n=1 Tax=Colletotrichum spaethianum TaxID=700344 RepID=A0AA37PGH5_9PEZI|nr:uncharacterized protein ColSpa_11898 [Colletotrichum spaethianum]GKT51717.1 hypothetical protein ColSpa_11898 [Colletotrichum spaethianum]